MANPTFSPLTEQERAWIAERLEGARRFVETFSPNESGRPVTLAGLDRAWAAWLQQNIQDNTEVNDAINMVGVQFGQFLVDRAGFQWTIASDAQGTDLAVLALPGRGDFLVYPANFVSKRWERRQSNFLATSFQAIQQDVAKEARRPWWRFW
jgi:hypothetical protein